MCTITKPLPLKWYRVQSYKMDSSQTISWPKLQTVSSEINSCPHVHNCFLWNYIDSKSTKVFPLQLYPVQTYKRVSSRTISCPKLQNYFVSNYIMSTTLKVFSLNCIVSKITKGFLWNYIVSWITKCVSSKTISCSKITKSFPMELYRVQKAANVFPLRLYRVQNYKSVSYQIISCPKLLNRFI